MQRIKLSNTKPYEKKIAKAAEILKNGGLVVCPTETVYIFAVDAASDEAIKKVYEIKGRDFNKPIHVVTADWAMINELCYTNEISQKLYQEFLPGPLTIVLNKKPHVSDILTGGLSTLGVRIPKNPITRALSKMVDFPYTATSANKSGGKNPYTIEEALSGLSENKKDLIDLILDVGQLPATPPSTIVDCSLRPKILREGPISKPEIEKALGLKVE